MDVLLENLALELGTQPGLEADVFVDQEVDLAVGVFVDVGVDSVAERDRQLVQEVKRVLGFLRLMLQDALDLVVELWGQLVLLENAVEGDFFFVIDCVLGLLTRNYVGKRTRREREEENAGDHEEDADYALDGVGP